MQHISFFRVLQSVLAAIFGVQSQKNMEADFAQGKLIYYVITGIIIVALILLALYFLVANLV